MPFKDPEKRRAYFQAYDRARAERHSAAMRRRYRARSPEWKIWAGMIKRCRERPDYIARGVCARWRSFENFLADMGARPTPLHSLERKRNGEGYSPDNCKWAMASEQQRNKRDNHIVQFRGRRKCVTAWAEEFGLTPKVVFDRLRYGWSPAKAFTAPVREYSR